MKSAIHEFFGSQRAVIAKSLSGIQLAVIQALAIPGFNAS